MFVSYTLHNNSQSSLIYHWLENENSLSHLFESHLGKQRPDGRQAYNKTWSIFVIQTYLISSSLSLSLLCLSSIIQSIGMIKLLKAGFKLWLSKSSSRDAFCGEFSKKRPTISSGSVQALNLRLETKAQRRGGDIRAGRGKLVWWFKQFNRALKWCQACSRTPALMASTFKPRQNLNRSILASFYRSV